MICLLNEDFVIVSVCKGVNGEVRVVIFGF